MSQPRPLEDVRRDLADAIRARDGVAIQTLLGQYKQGRAALRTSLKNIGGDATGYKVQTEKPFREGIGSSLVGSARAVTSLLTPDSATPAWASKEARDEQTRLDAPLEASDAAGAGRFVGDMAVGALAGGVAGGALKKALAGRATTGLGKAAGWAAEGLGGGAAVTGELDSGDAVMGVLGGKAAQALGTGLRVGARGLRRDPSAQTLLDYGADLTPGQLNPSGTWARLEGAAASSPFGVGGTAIRHAQETGLRPVVPNLVADVAGKPRSSVAGMNPREALVEAEARQNALYASANNIPATPAPALKLERLGAAALARSTKQNTAQTVRLSQATSTASRARLAETAQTAVARAAKDPTPLNIARAEEYVAKLREAEHAATLVNPRAPIAEGNAAARKQLDDFVPGSMKDLRATVRSSLERNALAKDATIGSQIERFARDALNAPDAKKIQEMRSLVRKLGRDAKYGANPDFATARVYKDAEEWFTKLYERAIKDPKILAKLREGDRIYAQLSPVRDATFRAGADPTGLIKGSALEDAMQRGQTEGGWMRGQGGPVREVAEALRGLEAGQAKGALQSRGTPQIVALLQGSIGTLGASPGVRKLARGDAVLQKALSAGEDSVSGQALKRALAALRPGLAATVADEDQPN